MNFKKFIVIFLGIVVLFLLMNYAIWKSATEVLLSNLYDGGDLARISYLKGFKHPRRNQVDLPRRHELLNDFSRQYDLLNIGDSFSLGIGGGRNLFYQDYIASTSNIRVASLWPYPTDDAVAGLSQLSVLILLTNSGLLDSIKPKYVLIESAQRYAIQRFAHQFDFGRQEDRGKIENFHRDKQYSFDFLPPMQFVNDGNFKYLYYNLLYRLRGNSYKIPSFHLTRRVFSIPWGDRLIVLPEEVSNTADATPATVSLMNDNLNRMADILAAKGIQLVFMPVVDKYELYRELIVAKEQARAPRGIFFDELRKLPRRYRFIDTKAILEQELKRGELDIFYADDSHWSWKAPQKIFETERFQ
jgi:SGNH hydrolase-like domain, acetyltransferase AlgX